METSRPYASVVYRYSFFFVKAPLSWFDRYHILPPCSLKQKEYLAFLDLSCSYRRQNENLNTIALDALMIIHDKVSQIRVLCAKKVTVFTPFGSFTFTVQNRVRQM